MDAEDTWRREAERVEKEAGVVPVPVAAMMEGSACRRSHSMVCPSDLCPSSRVSGKTRAAHTIGIRIRRPRPSTLLCRSFDGAFFTTSDFVGSFLGFGYGGTFRSLRAVSTSTTGRLFLSSDIGGYLEAFLDARTLCGFCATGRLDTFGIGPRDG